VESFLLSLSTVAIAEIGDRTQLLSLMLAAHYRAKWPVLAGILCATLANHSIAAWVGVRLGHFLTPGRLNLLVGTSMIGMAVWALKPDRAGTPPAGTLRANAFLATLVAFFVCEIGDKTQIATAALAAGYASLTQVIAGTTVGMLIANIPAVWLGEAFAQRLPLKRIHYIASVLFLLLGAVFIFRALHSS
jgi:Ca2+/H+ antiporter, TMEM165/GDT1 family